MPAENRRSRIRKSFGHAFAVFTIVAVWFIVAGAVSRAEDDNRGTTYYVDAVDGSDEGRMGQSEGEAWKTLSRVNQQRFNPGDRVLLKRGCVWRKMLTVNTGGASGKPVVIGAYGDGPKPVISGADVVSELTADASVSGLWRARVAAEPSQVFLDEKRGQRVAGKPEGMSPGQWHWAEGTLSILAGGKSAPSVQVSVREYAAKIDADYVTLEGIAFERPVLACVKHGARNGLILRDCLLTDSFVSGLHSGDEGDHDFGLIEKCEISRCGSTGLGFAGRMDGWIIRDNRIHQCGQLHEGQPGAWRHTDGSAWQEWSAGIKYWGWKKDGYLGSLLIERNIVEDCRAQFDEGTQPHKRACGIWIDESFKPRARTIIRRNLVRNNASKGIFIEKSDDCDVFANLCYNNAAIPFTANLVVESNFGTACRGNRIFHNTCHGGEWAMALNSYKGTGLTDNVFKNNIATGGKGTNLYVATEAANDGSHSSGNVFLNNCFGPERPGFIVWAKGMATYAAWETAYGGATNSVQADPMFVAAKSGNFQLQANSPCRGAGSNTGDLVKEDFGGGPIDNSKPDVGAWGNK